MNFYHEWMIVWHFYDILYVIWEFSLFNLGYSSVLLIFTFVFITLILKVNPWNVNVVSQLYCYDKHVTSQKCIELCCVKHTVYGVNVRVFKLLFCFESPLGLPVWIGYMVALLSAILPVDGYTHWHLYICIYMYICQWVDSELYSSGNT